MYWIALVFLLYIPQIKTYMNTEYKYLKRFVFIIYERCHAIIGSEASV
jgi:hypothetical protein